jgi:ATP-binding cassette subfamily B protein
MTIAAMGGPMEVGGARVPYGRLVRFAWHIVQGSVPALLGMIAIAVLVQLLTQYNSQILSSVTAMLSASASGAPAGKKDAGAGFLDWLLPQDLIAAAIVFAATALLLILAIFAERIYTAWADNLIATRLQHRLHDKLLALGPDYHRSHDVSETNLVVTAFAPGAQQVACDLIAFPLVRGLGFATALVFLMYNLQNVSGAPGWMQWALVAALVLLPLAGWKLSQGIVRASRGLVETQTALANEFHNSAANPTEIRLMGAEAQRSTAFARRLAEMRRAAIAAAIRRELGTQFQAAIPRILAAVFLLYGIFFALKSGDPAAVGAIVAFVLFIPLAVNPINELITFFIGISATWPQMEKVVEIIEAAGEREPEGAKPLPAAGAGEGADAIGFAHVTFAYKPGLAPVVNGLTHNFAANKVSAIVARSGAGKSTILNLIARQYRPQSGAIRLGPDPIAEATAASLRQAVVKISQFPVFLAGSVRENFRLAKQEASDAEIEAVARRTGLWPILENAAAAQGGAPLDLVLPRKLETLLSGGQQKLFAVTRGLLRKPRVLLIDEPTTGIDNIGIAELAKFLKPACDGVTTIVVDHKMAFVGQFADIVCCLEDGRFTDIGPPAQLDRPGTLYHQLKELERLEPEAGAPGAPPTAATLDLPPGAMPPGAMPAPGMMPPGMLPAGPMPAGAGPFPGLPGGPPMKKEKKDLGAPPEVFEVPPGGFPPGALPGGPMPGGPMKTGRTGPTGPPPPPETKPKSG